MFFVGCQNAFFTLRRRFRSRPPSSSCTWSRPPRPPQPPQPPWRLRETKKRRQWQKIPDEKFVFPVDLSLATKRPMDALPKHSESLTRGGVNGLWRIKKKERIFSAWNGSTVPLCCVTRPPPPLQPQARVVPKGWHPLVGLVRFYSLFSLGQVSILKGMRDPIWWGEVMYAFM